MQPHQEEGLQKLKENLKTIANCQPQSQCHPIAKPTTPTKARTRDKKQRINEKSEEL
jgi:hypothetical protein